MPPSSDVSLDAYHAERADFARLIEALHAIRAASLEELRSDEWLVALIRSVGLAPLPEAEQVYVGDEDYINASNQGVVQLPREFARYLLFLADHRPATYLEIGCFNGATASLATAYLQRFNPALQATTFDLWPGFFFYAEIQELLPLRYVVPKTSFDYRDHPPFDAVFIDGDHSFDWAWADYQNVGRRAKVCAIHDVHCAPYIDLPLCGVCGMWELIKNTELDADYIEIIEHPTKRMMGIGIRVRHN